MSDKDSGSRKSARAETAELISMVQHRPCLWNRNDGDYRHRPRKEQAWAEIFRALEPRYDRMNQNEKHEFGLLTTRKWNNIRDCYRKSRNGTSRSSVSGRPYIYSDLLTFLDVIYDSQNDTSKIKAYSLKYEGNQSTEEPEEPEEEWLNEVFVDMGTAAQESSPSPKKHKTDYTRTKEQTDADDSIVSVLVNLIEKEEDEDRAFFKSITPAVKSLPDEDKFVFRIQVMKLLNALKKRGRRSSKRERSPAESDTE